VDLAVGGEVLEPGVYVPTVERLEGSAHDLHVLLRHRLLRQPGSFEGFLGIAISLPANDPASVHREQVAGLLHIYRAADRPDRTVSAQYEDPPIVKGKEPLALDPKVVERSHVIGERPEHFGEPPPAPSSPGALGPDPLELDLWVDCLRGREVSPG